MFQTEKSVPKSCLIKTDFNSIYSFPTASLPDSCTPDFSRYSTCGGIISSVEIISTVEIISNVEIISHRRIVSKPPKTNPDELASLEIWIVRRFVVCLGGIYVAESLHLCVGIASIYVTGKF